MLLPSGEISGRRAAVLLSVAAVFTCLSRCDGGGGAAPAQEFSSHRAVRPRLLYSRNERLSVELAAEEADERAVLDLRAATGHLASDTLHYFRNGSRVTYRPPRQTCQYVGLVRGRPGSWAAVSACGGLRGVFHDGRELHYIQPADLVITEEDGLLSPHYLYRYSDARAPASYDQPRHPNRTTPLLTRYRRAVAEEPPGLRGPWSADQRSRYVELALVVDQAGFRANGESLHSVFTLCADIANIVNAMYAPLNIFVALVYVEVWSEGDRIRLEDNGDNTLQSFLDYRRKELLKEHYNDNAQLITMHRFDGGVVGKALKMMMCTYQYSGGITTNHSSVIGLVAATIAHEMGHNFGMEHDTEEDCQCVDPKCIMSPSSNALRPAHWSSCSQEALALSVEHGIDYCLRNKPTALFNSPTCGNGFVEAGEQCDCGTDRSGPCVGCCDPDSCLLRSNATCATGSCCDLTRCATRAAGTECRGARGACDLPEYCTGSSEYCPADVAKLDGLPCDTGAFCSSGQCRSHTDQCRLLWGSSGVQSNPICYNMNAYGNSSGSCGLDRMSVRYARCAPADALCGLLHCRHLSEKLEFGVEYVSNVSHAFINIGNAIIPCRSALVDLGTQQPDPGLVPDGASCGDDKMCEQQKCVSAAAVRARAAAGGVCPSDCSGRGVCNSRGSCHCQRGFAPPLCDLPGPGGSLVSGPASDPSVHHNFMVVMYVVFLGAVPAALVLLLLLYYSRHHVVLWWKRPRTYVPPHLPRSLAALRPSREAKQTNTTSKAYRVAGGRSDGSDDHLIRGNRSVKQTNDIKLLSNQKNGVKYDTKILLIKSPNKTARSTTKIEFCSLSSTTNTALDQGRTRNVVKARETDRPIAVRATAPLTAVTASIPTRLVTTTACSVSVAKDGSDLQLELERRLKRRNNTPH